MRTLLLAISLLLCATTMSFAQSLPNYGPNPPSQADSFGQPPSGAKPPGVPRNGHRAYAYAPHRHYKHRNRHYWYW